MQHARVSSDHDCLAGGGEMGALMRSLDWSRTPLGSVQSWSPALRTMARILLANRFPLLLWWGPEYIQLYNDAYRPIPGAKHPRSMGQPARECWSEIWHIIGPLIDTPFRGGPATWMDDIGLEINRHGFMEETHFTIAYSPVPDESVPSGIGGVLATVQEITEKVVGERRLLTLRDLARAGEARTAAEACAIAARTLAAHEKDVPFALLYLIDEDGGRARLAGCSGVAEGEPVSPAVVGLDGADGGGWPFREARRSEAMQVVDRLRERFPGVPPGPWSDEPSTAVVLPVPGSKARQPIGFLVAGVSARLRLDEFYRDFFELVTTQAASAIANARAYEEERKRAEALAELDRAKTVFFSNVSHEFRTPLTLMLGPLEEVLAGAESLPSPACRESIETAHRNSLRLLKLVNTLLDFSRIESGRIQAVYEPTDLGLLTGELASNFRSACQRAGLELLVDCPSLAEPVHVDRDMWEKLVLNLLSNAFKFTFRGRIQVGLREAGEAVALSVEDTGIGIPQEEIGRVFERFYRVRGAQGRTHEGTGIGLALVQELARLHGGSVRVESEVGNGSRFTVTVPRGHRHLPPDRIGGPRTLASTAMGAQPYVEEALRWLPDPPPGSGMPAATPAREPAVGSRKARAPRQEGGRRTVLLADDNADMRDYVRRILEREYEVVTVPDGDAALAAALASPPDLVLSDVMMPGLDGFSLLRELRKHQRTRTIPVVLLSARAGEESRVEGMDAGADDYLIKPFSGRELLARVSAHLELSRLRRDAERAVRESQERLQAAYQSAPVGICEVDLDGRFLQVNQRFCEITGYTREELLARRFQDITHPGDVEASVGSFGRLQAGEMPYLRTEKRYVHRDGHTVWIELHGALVHDLDGKPRFGIAIVQDITARKRVDEALRESDRRKDEFLAMLAHELRNPLAPLLNGLEVLALYGEKGSDMAAVREVMERQVKHMVRLIDDLLDISRINKGKVELRKERVDLRRILENAVEANRPLVEKARHQLTVTLPPEPLFLQADPARLLQVFGNLLQNAAKYTEEGGHLSIAAERRLETAVVRVRDDGIGIPAEKLPLIFDMFIQVEPSGGRSRGGLGLGLTLVKWMVEMHGGSVEARSEGPGRGSEFLVTLPLAAGGAGPGDDPDRGNGEPASLTGLKALVVDDYRDAAETLAASLRSLGAEVGVAYDGSSALQAISDLKPAVVFLDLGMPGIDGYEVARKVRRDPGLRRVKLVAVTGWGQEQHRRRSLEAGFDAHLVKPLDSRALRKLVLSFRASNIMTAWLRPAAEA